MYNQVSSKCSLTLQVKAWQYNDRDNYKIEIKEHINYVWIANYQEEIEIEDGIVDNFSNPLNNRNGYHNSIVSENVLLLWFISIYLNYIVSKLGFPTGRDSATFRDNGTEISSLSRDKGTTGQAQNFATGRDGILTACPVPSRDVPRDRNERKNIDKMAFFSMISCFRTSFPVLERPLLF